MTQTKATQPAALKPATAQAPVAVPPVTAPVAQAAKQPTPASTLDQILAIQRQGLVHRLFGAFAKSNPFVAFGFAYLSQDLGHIEKAIDEIYAKYPVVSYWLAYNILY
jgi:hypothetical protein